MTPVGLAAEGVVALTPRARINTVTHMKTTIEIADDLLTRSREFARERGLTLRALVEEGLALALARAEK